MTPFEGLLFFYIMGLMLLPGVILGLLGRPLKIYGLIFTAVMLTIVFYENGQLLLLCGFYVWQIVLCLGFSRVKNKTKTIFRAAVVLSLLPLLAVKLSAVFPELRLLQLLGISYMTFRAVQVLIDIYDGRTEKPRLLELSYFLLFFPSAAAGPIDRYRRFLGDINRTPGKEEYCELLRRGFWRLMTGAFSGIAVSGIIWAYWLEPLPGGGFMAGLSYMYGYTLYLYFNFAGYSSMAIGTAYILGVRLPENFNKPFLSADMKDFWARWHISLSTWLRDYVYTRFVMGSLKAKRFKNKRTASYIGYIITFAAMGAWHGLSPNYLIYGAYHALLMCVNEALDLHYKSMRKFKQGAVSRVLMAVVTFHFVSFGLLIFSGRLV
ncbi:MAG: D-alanyl-lipoteichoic acid biosynthesis protein DltB [Oscillospiraceae bacterium]|nr:D-alanyl-lipoteichoic acid biosynthesis protein DltB [Oscillospiraceae bacterium]